MIKAYNISENLKHIIKEKSKIEVIEIFEKLNKNFWFDFKINFTTIDVYKLDKNLFEISICNESIQTVKINSEDLSKIFFGELTIFKIFYDE